MQVCWPLLTCIENLWALFQQALELCCLQVTIALILTILGPKLSSSRNLNYNILPPGTTVTTPHHVSGSHVDMKKVFRSMEIDTENRVLLEKMMRIDLNPTKHHPKQVEPMQTPGSLSMNRLVRLKELVRVNDGNKVGIMVQ